MYDERTRGVKLRTMDLSVLIRQAAELPEAEGKEVSIGFTPYAMAETPGHLYVICSEGVGWEVTAEKPLEIPLYLSSPGHISIVPSAVAKLDAEEVRRFAATGEEVDLADHVRSFGARLESNFWMWHNRLSGQGASV